MVYTVVCGRAGTRRDDHDATPVTALDRRIESQDPADPSPWPTCATCALSVVFSWACPSSEPQAPRMERALEVVERAVARVDADGPAIPSCGAQLEDAAESALAHERPASPRRRAQRVGPGAGGAEVGEWGAPRWC